MSEQPSLNTQFTEFLEAVLSTRDVPYRLREQAMPSRISWKLSAALMVGFDSSSFVPC
jgi:hypothetical protein